MVKELLSPVPPPIEALVSIEDVLEQNRAVGAYNALVYVRGEVERMANEYMNVEVKL